MCCIIEVTVQDKLSVPLSKNAVLYVPTTTDDGKQWQEDRDGVEKRMASVLS